MADMTPEIIVDLCKKNGGYRQPHLNDQLYLQCRGFRHIRNLEPYVNCKAIWLDQNAISEVENLGHLTELATLFLQDNNIRRLNSSCFNGLSNLRILNLSNNNLSRLVGLQALPLLETLQLAHNRFESLESLRGMMSCQKLSSVDVSFNNLDRIGSPETEHNNGNDDDENENENDGETEEYGGDDDGASRDPDNMEKDRQFLAVENSEKLVEFWKQLPELGVLYLHGNELPRRCKFYRKRMICGLPQLMYLDERPIFPDERRTTEAWGRGGNDAEDAERSAIRDEKLAEMEKNVKSLLELKGAKKEMREKAERERMKRIEEEKEWRDAMQVEWARQRTEVDHLEYEQRAYLEQEEENVFAKVFSDVIVKDSIQKAREIEERRRLEEEVKREIEQEEKRMAEEMENHREQLRIRHEEMKKALEVFKQGEEENEESISSTSFKKKKNSSKSNQNHDDDDEEYRESEDEKLREEARAAFYNALKPKSEQEVMSELFGGAGDDENQKQQSKSAKNQQQKEQEMLSKVTAGLPSALQIFENVAKQIDNGDDVDEASVLLSTTTAAQNNKNNNAASAVGSPSKSAINIPGSQSTTTASSSVSATPSFKPVPGNGLKLPSLNRKKKIVPNPSTNSGGGSATHWDAFLNMESRHGARKF